MRILFAIPWSKTFAPPRGAYGDDQIEILVGRSDWNLRKGRKRRFHIAEALRILRAARQYDVVVICTVSIEAVIAGALGKVICPRTRIVCFDLLMPARIRPARWFLPRVDAFACIRTGDIDWLVHRMGVAREQCAFVPFPCAQVSSELETGDDGYIYSAGSSYRDWPTLITAIIQVGCRAIISAPENLTIPESARDRITVLSQQSPEDGRRLMSRASMVAVLPLETHRANGPLILLDAMAMGKPIITTRVNGSRDYISDTTALIVPAGDVNATAAAIRELMDNPENRQRIGLAGKTFAAEQFTKSRTVEGIIALCKRVRE